MFGIMSYGYSTCGIRVFQDIALFENMGDDDTKDWAYYGRSLKHVFLFIAVLSPGWHSTLVELG